MAALRRHWRVLLWLQGLAILALALAIPYLGRDKKVEASPSQAIETPQALIGDEPVSYVKIAKLRSELALSDIDLAAMGCDDTTVKNVIGTLVSWHSTNRDALASADQTTALARRELQEASRKINVGPADNAVTASIPSLVQNVQGAIAARSSMLDAVVATVNTKLSGDQQATWSAARANKDLSERVRFASGLSASQLQSLKQSATRGTNSDGEILNATQQSQVAAARTNVNARLTSISTLTSQLLPVPSQMRPVPTTAPTTRQPPVISQ